MTLPNKDIAQLKQLTSEEGLGKTVFHEDWTIYKRILTTAAYWKVPSNYMPDISAKLKTPSTSVSICSYSHRMKWLVAASISLFLLVGLWILNLESNVEITVPLADKKTIWLPDSSRVVLNAGATLTYSKTKWEEEARFVELKGLAYFDVKKGSNFTVSTEHGRVEVLGTSFNVWATNERYIVECITGKVAVTSYREGEPILLTPGLKTYKDLQSGLLIPGSFDLKQGKEWMTGVFSFYNQNIDEVWAELERQFDVEVIYNGSGKRFYTGVFKNKNLNEALVTICHPMNMRFEIDQINKSVIISD